ncbi:MAG: MFS transporter [Candidatus Thorarchaeota archaeon]
MSLDNGIKSIEEKVGFKLLLKKLWPSFLVYNSFAFTISTIFINVLIISNIMWPGEGFHSYEIGFLAGISMYAMALSGILFGILADRFSRIKLMAFSQTVFGIGLFLNGFVPDGLGNTTWILFVILTSLRSFASGGNWPIINSYANDRTEEKDRSQFFGLLQAFFQLFQILGMVLSAFLFQNYFWREYFWFLGIIAIIFGVLIFIKGIEPKRAATHEELKGILINAEIKYDYKLNYQSFKSTILKPTNFIAFIEGLFTTILISIPDFLVIAYIQSEVNFSPFAVSIMMILFGLPGGLFGSLAFAKISDKLGKKNLRNRVYMIFFSAITTFLFFIVIFFLPFPYISSEEGLNLLVVFSMPIVWIAGLFIFIGRGVMGLWNINQPPILQAINLPEAQGFISSTNQFLELIGSGSGNILAGFLLAFFDGNYQVTVLLTMSIGIIGGFLWLFAAIWINKDVERISEILKQRGIELTSNNNKERVIQ